MNASLLDGLEIVLVVSVAAVILMPVLLWVLPDRIHQPENGTVA